MRRILPFLHRRANEFILAVFALFRDGCRTMEHAWRVRINYGGTVRCEPEWQWNLPAERLRDFDLWYVWAGVGTLSHVSRNGNDFESPIHRGSLYLLRPNHEYHGRHDRKRRLGVCYVHFDFIDQRGRAYRPKPADVPPMQNQVRDPGAYEAMLRRIVHLHHSANAADRTAANRLLEAILLTVPADRLSDTAADIDTERYRRVDAIANWIREHPGHRVTVEQLADRTAYAVDHFTRIFTQRIGRSPVAFLIECRIDRAKELLATSALTVEQVATALGYSDLFYFSRQFKRLTGLPPARWRTQFLSSANTHRS